MKNFVSSFDEPARVIKRADAPEEIMYALTFSDAVSGYFRQRFSKENFRRIMRETFPQKVDSTSEKTRKCIRFISLVLLIAGLCYFVFYYCGYRERIDDFEDWQNTLDKIDEDKMPDFEIRQFWNNIKQQYPDVEFPAGMMLKFASIYAVNQDAVGLINIPEKNLWQPLFQKKSEPDYYLWKDMYGNYSRYGNPYVDARCNISKDGFSKNTIIYGHNTHDKLGFNKLTTYMTLDGYKEAPVVTIETLYEKTQWKIFGVILTNSGSAQDRGHLFRYLVADFESDNDFMTMIDGIYERSMINTGVDVNKDDKVLTLYTCYQDIFEGGRLVIFARLLREGEKATVDVSQASFNHNARYPQAYYEKLGLTNPYEKLTKPIGESVSETKKEETTTKKSETTTKKAETTTKKADDKATTKRPEENTKPAQTQPATTVKSETTTVSP